MNKLAISIIGSCVSRDNFNSAIVKNYKDFFDLKLYQYQMSIISLMSKPVVFEEQSYESELEYFYKEHFITELDKSILNRLMTIPPEYLVLDFYGDCYYGVIQYKDSYITNTENYFKHINLYRQNTSGIKLTIETDPEGYFDLWKRQVDKFITFMKSFLPNVKIVINKARFVNEYFDESSNQYKLVSGKRDPIGDINFKNKMWNRMDLYVIENYGLRYIDYGDFEYKIDDNHKWGIHYVHYTNDYYYDFNRKLLQIAMNDLLENKDGTFKSPNKHLNLVDNGEFKRGKNNWSYWRKEFEIFEEEHERYVSINSIGKEKNEYFQCWTNAMQIEANGLRKYKLSFKVRVKDKHLLDNSKIFAVRIYNHLFKTAEKQSVQHDYINLPDGTVENEWVLLEHIITPLTGRYAKVGPFLFKNGHIDYKDIEFFPI